MARPFPSSTILPKGILEFVTIKPNLYRAFFTPPMEAIPHNSNPIEFKRQIFDINLSTKILMIYPYRVMGCSIDDCEISQTCQN